MKQHSVQFRKPSSQQGILKKAERHVCLALSRHEWLAVEFIQAILTGYTSSPEQDDIDIYAQRTTKLLTPIIKSFVYLNMLIQNERTRWFMMWTSCSAFIQGIVRVGYPPCLLLLWILDDRLCKSNFEDLPELYCVIYYKSYWEINFQSSSKIKNSEIYCPQNFLP